MIKLAVGDVKKKNRFVVSSRSLFSLFLLLLPFFAFDCFLERAQLEENMYLVELEMQFRGIQNSTVSFSLSGHMNLTTTPSPPNASLAYPPGEKQECASGKLVS